MVAQLTTRRRKQSRNQGTTDRKYTGQKKKQPLKVKQEIADRSKNTNAKQDKNEKKNQGIRERQALQKHWRHDSKPKKTKTKTCD